MAESALFRQLKHRISTLETKFLGTQLADELANPLSFQTDVDMLAAFRLLVHAELEDYLERKARTELDAIDAKIKTAALRPDFGIYALANHFGCRLPHDCPFDQDSFTKFASTLVKKARDFLADNNGIKSTTFLAVCVICSKPVDEIDSTLGAALKSYGEARGEVAHKSTARVTNILAPSAEKKNAGDILDAISAFFYS